ncbi:MAG: fibrobacter succinogenes major paralogous domain-containing protein [Candidatus Symbiothrix sp.]|nr:fibrobacter succinogenes major paralogous domain-containing protein [Candidatus Symbiothrix sp.]
MKKWLFYAVIFFPACFFDANAQVTIGDLKNPESFSVLELISKNGTQGIIHPQMNEAQRDAITAPLTSAQKASARGLVIYNTTEGCLNLYRNESEGWVSLCSGVIIPLLKTDAAEIRPLEGTLPGAGAKGKSGYDIAQSNSSFTNTCGVTGSPGRPGDFGNFSGEANLRKYYEIVFPAGTYSDLTVGGREYAVPFFTVTGNREGSFNGGTMPLTVDFDPKIKELAYGTKENNALSATLFAVYRKNDQWYKAEYKLSVMDCLGCGVRVQSGEKEWLKVACYNLGENTPAVHAFEYADFRGNLYQWGRQTDGHELRESPLYLPKAALGEIVYPTAPLDSLDAGGQPAGERKGAFIPVTGASKALFGGDWSVLHHPALWGDGTQNLYPPKAASDPCPKGFKVPSKTEMEKIMNALDMNWTKLGGTAKEDGILFLPLVSYRKPEYPETAGSLTAYWTATPGATPAANRMDFLTRAYALTFDASSQTVNLSPIDKASGAAIRCIAE